MSTVLRALHATLRQIGLDDDDKRALYSRVTGKWSAKDMSEDERAAVKDELERLYPQIKTASKRKATRFNGRSKLSGKYAAKLQALWIAGWNLGLVRNRDDAALEAFVKRQTGLDAVRFCHHPEDAAKAIEALKSWLAREGGVDWSVDKSAEEWSQLHGYRIAKAQGRLLGSIYVVPQECAKVLNAKPPYAGHHLMACMTSSKWITVMNALGKRIRAAHTSNSEAA